ncbi:MAG TPA: YdcF family protein [Clostridium sp.]
MKIYIDILLGIILIGYTLILNTLSSTKVAFSSSIGFLGICLILYHFLKIKLKDNKYFIFAHKSMKPILYVGIACFIILQIIIVSYPKKNNKPTDYILVLGAGLRNGTELTLSLKDRLDTTLDYIHSYNSNSYIVVSGGQGSDEDMPEALAMANYLIANSIPKDKIIIEDKSVDTFENFKFSKVKIEEHSNKPIADSSVKIITTDFHAFRSNILAKRNGYMNINLYTTETIPYLIPVFYSRESIAIVKSFLFDN